jgi:hypothetical protein
MAQRTCITGLHTVGDQDAALAFYEALGFERRLDVPIGEGARWIEVAPPGAAVTLALEPAHGDRPTPTPPNEALRSRGVDADDVLRWPGVPAMSAFRDQDGNGLEIGEA